MTGRGNPGYRIAAFSSIRQVLVSVLLLAVAPGAQSESHAPGSSAGSLASSHVRGGGVSSSDFLAPPQVRPEWADYIGDCESKGDRVYILERHGNLGFWSRQLRFLRMKPVSGDRFSLEGAGKPGSPIFFERDERGAVSRFTWRGKTYQCRFCAVSGKVFHISLLRPVEQLRREALASHPPSERRQFAKVDLVQVVTLDPSIKLDIRYATSRNFMGAPLYSEPRAFLEEPAARALVRVSEHLRELGFGLLIYDAYRPWYDTKMFWDGTPPAERIFVANPVHGSRHNRGCAVDLTLYDLKSGLPVEMPSGYDEMSERAYPSYPGGTSLERWHRDLLRRVMRNEGFIVNPYEWWHFDFWTWRHYPILNLTFEQLDR
jgi:D-alanyl-D-alanine dipeptidase